KGNMISAALSEVSQMVEIGYFCTKNMMEIGNNPGCNNRVVMRTYEAYFGGIVDGSFGQDGQVIQGTHLLHFYIDFNYPRQYMLLTSYRYATPTLCDGGYFGRSNGNNLLR